MKVRPLSSISPGMLRIEPQYALFVVLLVTLGSFILYPVLIVFTNSFHGNAVVVSDATWSFDAWRTAFAEPGMRAAAWNTVKVLFCTELIAMPIAVLIAWLLARTDIPGNSLLEFMFWVSFFLPALSVTFGWIALLDPHAGVLNQLAKLLPFVETGPFNIYSFWGIIWAHVATQAISVKVMLLTPSFRNLDSAFEEAARVSGANRWQMLIRIVIPVAFPAILTVLVLSAIRVMQTFEIEMVLGTPFNFFVFGTMIFQLVDQSPPQFGSAAALASIVFMIVTPLIVIHRWLVTRKDYASITGRIRIKPTQLGRWRISLFVLVCLLVVVITVLPVSFVVIASLMKLFGFFSIPDPWTFVHWTRVLTDDFFIHALNTTLRVAFGVTLTSIVLCTLVAYFSVRSRYRGRGILDFLSWLPFAIPGILLGIGFLYLVLGNPVLRFAYGTTPLLILAMVIAHMTLGTQIVKSAMLQLGNQLEEAGRVNGASWGTCLRKIVVPILAPTLALVGVANFIASTRDIATIALLAANDSKTLSLLQLDYLTDGQLETGAVLSVILIALSTGVAIVARLLGLKMGVRD